jgi:hypothetical protein
MPNTQYLASARKYDIITPMIYFVNSPLPPNFRRMIKNQADRPSSLGSTATTAALCTVMFHLFIVETHFVTVTATLVSLFMP